MSVATITFLPGLDWTRRHVDADPWMSVTDVCAALGVSRSTLHRMSPEELPYAETRGGPDRRGRRKYRRSDVQARLGRTSSIEQRVSDLERRVERLENGQRTPTEPRS